MKVKNIKIIGKTRRFIKKYCYLTIPSLLLPIIYLLYKFNLLNIQFNDEYFPTLVSISGTLIGFLLTAMTIFFSLNKNIEYMRNFKKYKQHIVFSRIITFGIIFLSLNIGIWLFNGNSYIIVATFLIGLLETLMATYYTYRLAFNSFK